MTITDLMNEFIDILLLIPDNLRAMAISLVTVLSIIDISLMSLELENNDILKVFIRKVIKIGFFYWIVIEYKFILRELVNGFLLIGKEAIPSFNLNYMENPSAIVTEAIKIYMAINSELTVSSPFDSLFLLIISLIIFLAFMYIVLNIFVVWIETYLLLGVSIIFIPFGILKKTSFIVERVFLMFFNLGIRLTLMSIVLSLSLNKIYSGYSSLELGDLLHYASIIFVISFLILKSKDLSNALIGGSPQLSGNDFFALGTATVHAGSQAVDNIKGAGSHVNSFFNNVSEGYRGGGGSNIATRSMGANIGRLGAAVKGGISNSYSSFSSKGNGLSTGEDIPLSHSSMGSDNNSQSVDKHSENTTKEGSNSSNKQSSSFLKGSSMEVETGQSAMERARRTKEDTGSNNEV